MDDFLGSIGVEAPEDVSFTIEQPSAGALFKGGSSTGITWTLPEAIRGATDVTIEYSKDGGATWSVAAAATSNSGSFTWILPSDDSNDCKVRVKAIVGEGLTATAESGLFGIDSTPPTLGSNQIGADRIVVAEDGSVHFNINAATDAHPGITYEIVSPVGMGSLSECLQSNSVLSCTYTPAANDNGTVSFTYRAIDKVGNVTVGTAQVDIEITPVNDAPVLVFAPCATSVNQDMAYACTPPTTDVDTGDTHTYSFAGAHTCGAWMSVNAATGEISGTPGSADVGTCTIALRVNDGTVNTTITQSFVVNNTVNDPPIITATCPSAANEDSAYACSVAPAVADPDAGDTHTWSFDVTNDCAWATINAATGAIGGTPNNAHVGSCTLAFKATDNGGLDSNVISVAVTVNNTAPTLTIADAANIAEDSPATVIRNDAAVQASDEGQGTTTYGFDHAGTSGTKCDDHKISLTIDASTGAVTYQPEADWTGTCNIKVSFSDGNGGSVSDEFSITVSGENDAPVITATCPTSVNEDSAYSCSAGPSVNDPDAGDTHTWSFDATNDCSWATIDPGTGVIGGTPDNGDVGTCTLAFLATDDGVGTLDSNVISVSVTVNNTAPTLIISDAANIAEDSAATVIRDDAAVQASDEGQGTTTYTFDHATTSGTKCDDNKISLTIDANTGAVTYQPAANYNGTCNIKVSFSDGNGGTIADEFSITVTDVNDAPVIAATCPTSSNEDSAYSCSAGPDVTDPDAGDTHTWSFDATNDCSWATIDPGTGAIGGIPHNGHVGTCTLAFLATDDGVGTLDSNVISVSVTVTNTAPTLTVADAADIAEDATATVIRDDAAVQASDEGQGTTVYSFDHATTSGTKCEDNKISLTIDANTGAVTYQPAANYNGTCNIKVSFSDGNGGTVSDEFSITVTAVNDAPVITAACPTSVNEDSAYTCSTGPDVTDPDAGDTHTWSFDATNDCSWATIDPGTGAIGGTPHNGHVGTCTLAFLATDDGVGTLDSNVISQTVTVNNVAPTLTIADAADIAEDAAATVIRDDAAVQASDEGQGTTTYSFDHATTSGTKCDDNKISLTIDANTGAVTYQPAANYNGTCNIKVSFSDGNGGSVSEEFSITVTGENDAPVITATCPTSLNEDVAYTCSSGPDVTDPDTGDTHTWSFTVGHDCLWANINSSTGEITGTPNDDEVGSCTLEFKANDGTADSNIISFGVTVNNVQPTLSIADATMEEDEGLTTIRVDTDVEASDETYGVYSLVAATGTKCSDHGTVSIHSVNGEIEFTPADDFAGTCNINVQFDDGNAVDNIVTAQFQVTVDPINDIPIITSWPPDQEIFAGNSVTGLAVVANPGGGTDEAAQTLSWDTCESSNPLITVTCNAFTGGNATIDIDTTSSQAVSSIITLKVVDSEGGVSLARTFTVNTTTGVPLYDVAGSLRFNDDDSASLTKTFSTTGSRTTWTWSAWIKRSNLTNGKLFSDGATSCTSGIGIDGSNRIYAYVADGTCGANPGIVTNAVFRDPATWMHIVWAVDTTQATPSDRNRIYIDGERITSFSTENYPTQNYNSRLNTAVKHFIADNTDAAHFYFDGYLADIHFIDGQALSPTAFANETDKGEWLPKPYAGTHGTNGFHLDFSNPTNTTTLGSDASGNANNWTLNNLAVTDHVIDTPTNNFATMSAISASSGTFSDGNLVYTTAGATYPGTAYGLFGVSTKKWYWEVVPTGASSANGYAVGVASSREPNQARDVTSTAQIAAAWDSRGGYYINGSGTSTTTFTTGDVIGIAFDADARSITYYKNGSLAVSFSGLNSGQTWLPTAWDNTSVATPIYTFNFGQGGQSGLTYYADAGGYFKHQPPAGFKALSTKNLPDPVIAKPNEYFDAVTYIGNGSSMGDSLQISSFRFGPDLVWIKNRHRTSTHHAFFDSLRGANKVMNTNQTIAEYNYNGSFPLTLNGDGFTLTHSGGSADYNLNLAGDSYAASAWKKGATPGFDIVSYTGDGTNNRTISHSLGIRPSLIITKNRDGYNYANTVNDWNVWHVSAQSGAANEDYQLWLHSTAARNVSGWGSAAATSIDAANFIPAETAYDNVSGRSYIAYLWSEVEGFSKFGSYTGNGTTDGPFVYTGFKPRFLLVKTVTSGGGRWILWDAARSSTNVVNKASDLGSTETEAVLSGDDLDFLSNGFKIRRNASNFNTSGTTIIYAAFAESPFKKGLNRPKVEFSLASSSAGENAGTVNIELVLDKAAASDIVVNYTVSGTASAPADHNLISGSTTIAAGQTSKNIPITIVDDVNYENPDETVIVTLTSSTVANLGSVTQHTLTITNNDLLPPEFVGIDIVSGPPAGGTTIVIDGVNFQPGAEVDIGGEECTVTNVTSTTITCETPAGTPGYADIVITNPDGQVVVIDNGFFYDEPFLEIANSVRFNDDDGAQFTRTMSAAATDSKRATLSVWTKRGNLGTSQYIAGTASAGTTFDLNFNAGNFLNSNMAFSDGNRSFTTNAVFRDPGAWIHIVLAIDTTAALNTDRIKLYVNGVQQTFSSATYPAQNATLSYWFVNGTTLRIGAAGSSPAGSFFDGYMASYYGIDGQALAPTAFAGFDASGFWRPKVYSGTYGTNGFHLDFSNSASLGTDVSSNGNNWTPNNLDATDWIIDTPTNNFSVLDPIGIPTNNNGIALGSLSNGGLVYTGASSVSRLNNATIAPSSGKWYYETNMTTHPGGGAAYYGIRNSNTVLGNLYVTDGTIWRDGVSLGVVAPTYTTGDIMAVTWDIANREIKFYKNNSLAYTISNSTQIANSFPTIYSGHTFVYTFNFGQGGQSGLTYHPTAGGYFKHAPPAGFKALSTKNLPDPAVPVPREYFDALAYAGTGTAPLNITGLKFQPDFVWIKNRSAALSHALQDTVRGITRGINTDTTAAENNFGNVSAVTANGFTLGNTNQIVNTSANNYISWNWRQSALSGFDIVSYTGNGAYRAIPHSLDSHPKMIIIKDRTGTNDWAVYHAANTTQPATDYLLMNSTAGTTDDNTYWNDATPGYTKLLLHGDGANGSTSVADSSVLKHAIAVNGNAQVSTSQSKFGGASIAFDGAGDYLNIPQNPDFAFGTGDFTIEFWYRPTGYDQYDVPLASWNQGSNTGSWRFYHSGGTGNSQLNWQTYEGAACSGALQIDTTPNTWQHIAVTRSGSTARGFVNGVQVASTTDNCNITSGYDITVGRGYVTAQHYITGHMDEIRISKGIARWTADFTPPSAAYELDETENVFHLGTNVDVNANSNQYVAYLFAEKEGFSRFGSYTGNGSADGPFIYTGFQPRFVMVKRTNSTENWMIQDAARSPYNIANNLLFPSLGNAESAGNSTVSWDFLSNGFKIRNNGSPIDNASGSTYIYAAFAEHPLNPSLNRPKVTLASESNTVNEDVGTVNLAVKLDREADSDITVYYTVSGTASYPDDHNLASGSITIPAGSLSQNLSITIVDDPNDEPDETIIVTLTGSPTANLGVTTVHTLTILDDDLPAPTFTGIDIDTGDIDGGTVITIDGENFQPGATVTVGGVVCTVTNVTPTQITCETGAGTIGWGDIVITNPDTQTVVIDDGFFYGKMIAESLRFNDDDSAYLQRNPGVTGNRRTFTLSTWVKRSNLGTGSSFFSASPGDPNYFIFKFTNTDNLEVFNYSDPFDWRLVTTAVFRDPAAWYHIFVAVDTTAATASDRVKLYVNGELITSFSTANYPSLNFNGTYWNHSIQHRIGNNYENLFRMDGYFADMYSIDGQALEPTEFGGFDARGVWQPKNYTGAYGTNGFHLDFSNSGSLGADSSGNSNNWTPNNLDATDQVIDTPTNGFATMNIGDANQPAGSPVSQGALTIDGTGAGGYSNIGGNFTVSSGKWYWEFVTSGMASAHCGNAGVMKDIPVHNLGSTYPGNDTIADAVVTYWCGATYGNYLYNIGVDGTTYSTGGIIRDATNFPNGTVVGVALDMDNRKIWFGKNSTWNEGGTQDPAANTGGFSLPHASASYKPLIMVGDTTFTLNFGQGGQSGLTHYPEAGGRFKYAPPAGFKALSTRHLPKPTIHTPTNYFNAVTYAGQSTNLSISSLAFAPDLVWIKKRTSEADNHNLVDKVRGASSNLATNLTSAAATANRVASFDTNGFTLTGNVGVTCDASRNYAAWNWKESPQAGFDIVTYTGNGTTQNVPHNLGVKPDVVIVKRLDTTGNWLMAHKSLTDGFYYLLLNSTNAQSNASGNLYFNGGGTGNSSVIYLGSHADVNAAGGSYVAYVFAEKSGLSKFGSYTGNGSADGPFVHTGTSPRWVMIKELGAADNWEILDMARDTHNPTSQLLEANTSNTEFTLSGANSRLDSLSNGFKIRTSNHSVNNSGSTYIYMTFGEAPAKYSRAK